MARSFAEQSGGALAVDSAPGRGATVSLWIPVAPETGGAQGAERRPPLARRENGPAILLVDDEEALRHVLAAELADQGFRVVEAADGLEALRLLGGDLDINVLVTDLTMAGTNGVDLIRAAQAARPRLPALLITGNAVEAATSFLAESAPATVGLVRKPIDSAGLAERIMALLERSRLASTAPCGLGGNP
jgi:CheY-like chemotaxis protein